MSGPAEFAPESCRGEGRFPGAGGCRLFFRWARPAQPRGVLVVVHGLGEHSGRYQAMARALVAGQFAYYGHDLRGHGQSDGPRGDVRRFGEYTEDLDAFLREVRGREERLPIFLMGHSLGGVIAVLYALDHPSGLAGLVAASTPFELASPPTKFSLIAARLLSVLTPRLTVGNDLDPGELSSDPEVVAAYLTDPLVQRRVTIQWAREFFGNYPLAIERASKLSLPLLVLHSEGDKIASVAGARAFLQRAGSADKTLHAYPDLRHELLNELPERRRQVFADLLAWLAAHVKAQ